MRYNEIILHEFIIKLDGISVFRNPIKPIIFNMFRDAEAEAIKRGGRVDDARLRGLITSGKIYIWNGIDGMHSTIVRRLKEEGFIDQYDFANYTGFYLDMAPNRLDILESGFYSYGKDRKIISQPNRDILNKFLVGWNI